MSDSLYELLLPHLSVPQVQQDRKQSPEPLPDLGVKYLSRLLSLRLSDLTTSEPQSLAQATQSNVLSLQALSSRSYRTATESSTHLSTLKDSLPHLSNSSKDVREAIPALDEAAVTFASTYSRLRGDTSASTSLTSGNENVALAERKEAQLLTRQADKLQDVLELPSLLSAAIASAGSGVSGSANYSQALDLFAHIKRLQIILPDSQLIKSILIEAEVAMKDMTKNLLASLRNRDIRLAAAIRTIGWLKRVAPELSNPQHMPVTTSFSQSICEVKGTTFTPSSTGIAVTTETKQMEGSFAAVYLTARLAMFLSMTQALEPLRELADQETDRRIQLQSKSISSKQNDKVSTGSNNTLSSPTPRGRDSLQQQQSTYTGVHQTERYLKRYIEIFREQSFNTISMYRNIFPSEPIVSNQTSDETTKHSSKSTSNEKDIPLPPIPSTLQTFPLHLVEILFETLRIYLPNISDVAARESLLMQVLYAANSLGRLGADFSMMIAMLEQDLNIDQTQGKLQDHPQLDSNKRQDQLPKGLPMNSQADQISNDDAMKEDSAIVDASKKEEDESEGNIPEGQNATHSSKIENEPDWLRVIKKHRIQSARLDALAAGQQSQLKPPTEDVVVR